MDDQTVELERLGDALHRLVEARRRASAVERVAVHLRSHQELVEIEKRIVELRVAQRRAEFEVEDLVERWARAREV
jgi:hypothetical protein